jgi:hypothetical protein
MSVPTVALLAAATQAVLLVLVILAERYLGATWGLITLVVVLVILLAALDRLGFLRVD